MKTLWSDEDSCAFSKELGLRVYTSNLLGRSNELVLHGGGNTSVKTSINGEDILFVKGSGWDLVSIKKEGFAPVKLKTLQDMAKLDSLSDSDMVAKQREAMIDKTAPNPSVEAILHANIPFKYVDHTHSDAIVTITNSINGDKLIREIFPNFLIVPYVMPGFVLAKEIYEMTKDINWQSLEGIILLNHGIFTFDDDAKKSYEKMIDAVSIAEEFLNKNAKLEFEEIKVKDFDFEKLKNLISKSKGYEVTLKINSSLMALNYTKLPKDKITRGVLTPEHIIRTKKEPLVLKQNSIMIDEIEKYKFDYLEYFKTFAKDEIMLNPTPNYAVVEDVGIVSFGKDDKEAGIINDIVSHTIKAVLQADKLGGYKSIGLKDSFMMEYWELEQKKLKAK